MDYIIYVLTGIGGLILILIIMFIVEINKNKQKEIQKETEQIFEFKGETAKRRCPTCGQLLEPEWVRCPFCAEEVQKVYSPPDTHNIKPVGLLITKTGVERGNVYKIEKEMVTIGSSSSSDIVIKDDEISPHHAVLNYYNGQFLIKDISNVGTKVNGKYIQETTLNDNDLIQIGPVEFIFKKID